MARAPYDEQSVERPRTLIWWIFCMPGALLMWWEYMFPSRGQVYATGRRYNNRIVQFLYTMGLYVGLAALGVIFLGPKLERSEQAADQPIPAVAEQIAAAEENPVTVLGDSKRANEPEELIEPSSEPQDEALAVEEPVSSVLASSEEIAVELALTTGAPQSWQSRRDSGAVSVSSIQNYVDRECRMVRVAVNRSGGEKATTDQLACRQDGGLWRYPADAITETQ